MNIYLLITLFGLALKLAVTYKVFLKFPNGAESIRIELFVFIYTFLAYSFVQILLFAPESLGHSLGIERIKVIRLYYVSDGVSLIVGGYLLMSMLQVKFHKHPIVFLTTFMFVTIGGYVVIMTNYMVDGVRPGPRGLITLSKGADYVFIGQAIVFLCTAVTLIALVKSYQSAKSNSMQIKSVYALAAALVYDINCFVGLYKTYPMIMAIRGVIFYVVVLVIMQRDSFFDLRPNAPTTIESGAMREFGKIFRDYSAEKIGHKESIKRIEKRMVAYKLEKISGFKEGSGSTLPQVASSMGVQLSTLYDILKRLGIDRPKSKKGQDSKAA